MVIKPSEYMWKKFKDLMHLYVMVGLIPIMAVSAYVNLTQGQAQLAETPEGYEPKLWEYEKYPMTRLYTRMFPHPAAEHERKMYVLNYENEKLILRRIEMQVRAVMSVRNDFQAWYYDPYYAKPFRHMRDMGQRLGVLVGFRDSPDLSEMKNPER